jgi:hypothetical protein
MTTDAPPAAHVAALKLLALLSPLAAVIVAHGLLEELYQHESLTRPPKVQIDEERLIAMTHITNQETEIRRFLIRLREEHNLALLGQKIVICEVQATISEWEPPAQRHLIILRLARQAAGLPEGTAITACCPRPQRQELVASGAWRPGSTLTGELHYAIPRPGGSPREMQLANARIREPQPA